MPGIVVSKNLKPGSSPRAVAETIFKADTATLKRIAWAYGCAKKGSDEERQLYALLMDRAAKESEVERFGFVPMPADKPPIYNGSGTPCDMWIGPCCCGATHTAAERTTGRARP